MSAIHVSAYALARIGGLGVSDLATGKRRQSKAK